MFRKEAEKIVQWIVMLDTTEFHQTDANIVRNEMLELIGDKEDYCEKCSHKTSEEAKDENKT